MNGTTGLTSGVVITGLIDRGCLARTPQADGMLAGFAFVLWKKPPSEGCVSQDFH